MLCGEAAKLHRQCNSRVSSALIRLATLPIIEKNRLDIDRAIPVLDDHSAIIQKLVMVRPAAAQLNMKPDRYAPVYVFGFVAIYFLIFIAYVPFFLRVCGAVFGVAYALYALFQIAAALARGQWRRILSIAVPLILIAILCGIRIPVAPRDKLWIAAALPFRWLQVQTATSDTPRFMAFSADCRGDGGFGSVPDCLSIVYDESDEIGLPNDQRSQEWRTRNESALMTSGSASAVCDASHVIGHYWVQHTL